MRSKKNKPSKTPKKKGPNQLDVHNPKSSVKSIKQFPLQCAQLSLILTAAAPFHAKLSDLLNLLSTTVDRSLSLKLTMNRFPTNFTRSTRSAHATRAPLPIKFTTRLMLVLTRSPLKVASQSKSNTTSNQATADRVARRPTHAPTRNRESLWPITSSAQLLTHVSVPPLQYALQYVPPSSPAADLHCSFENFN